MARRRHYLWTARGDGRKKGVPDPAVVAGLAHQIETIAAQEIARFIQAASQACAQPGQVLAGLGQAARQCATRIGQAMIEQTIQSQTGHLGEDPRCPDQHRARLAGTRPKTITTLLGPVTYQRAYYHCAICATGWCPADQIFGITRRAFSAAADKALAIAGRDLPFRQATDLIEQISGQRLASPSSLDQAVKQAGLTARTSLAAETHAIQTRKLTFLPGRWRPDTTAYLMIDGTGAPVIPAETRGRTGKHPDGRSRTREVKIGRFFTQTHTNHNGQPVIDPGSDSFIATFDPIDQFTGQTAIEALRRDFPGAPRLVVIGDGAKWIWGIADRFFPDSIQIVDYYHARQHLTALADLTAAWTSQPDHYRQQLKDLLDAGHINALHTLVTSINMTTAPDDHQTNTTTELAYFTGNHHRMRYAAFKHQGLYIGSGAIESACKTIIEQRTKQSGMRWTVPGCDAVIILRALHRSPGREHLIWEHDLSQTHTQEAA